MQFHASAPQAYADKVYLMIYGHRRAAAKNESPGAASVCEYLDLRGRIG